MDCFLISQDRRIPNPVEPVGVPKSLGNIANHDETDLIQLSIKDQEYNEYVDFIERPLPLVSDRLKQLLKRLEKEAAFVPVILADRKRGIQQVYWSLIPPKLDCLSFKTQLHKNGTIKKLVINPTSITGFRLFQIDGIMEKFIVVNLIVVESMLRRNLTGYKFTKVELES